MLLHKEIDLDLSNMYDTDVRKTYINIIKSYLPFDISHESKKLFRLISCNRLNYNAYHLLVNALKIKARFHFLTIFTPDRWNRWTRQR